GRVGMEIDNGIVDRLGRELKAVGKLRRELQEARSIMVALLPEPMQGRVGEFLSGRSPFGAVVDPLVEQAYPPPYRIGEDKRGECPLCGTGSYAIPEGVRGHLLGRWHNNRCPIAAQIQALWEMEGRPIVREAASTGKSL